ncbi:hypothetical protein [Dethiobacter alkaliphilus]|uniref:Uncharacterized protein n=1 Tax=Dethiobacter alkaliphilus AHT 1 TaxID=555088 RepID=C0GE88_DETAL|nr:hypothetical protein [Dethiobacter alkaliphilus]EEG78382.1 hypothetical protein DealDRAFT_0797 [Dethiobacter alkaliphilus AHT 1]
MASEVTYWGLSISNWISVAGVMVTAIFSFLLWRATIQTNDVAKASYKLSETIAKTQKSVQSALHNELLENMLQQAEIAKNILLQVKDTYTGKTSFFSRGAIRKLPINVITKEELAEYFNDEERKIIKDAFDGIEEYVSRYSERYSAKAMDDLDDCVSSIEVFIHYASKELDC